MIGAPKILSFSVSSLNNTTEPVREAREVATLEESDDDLKVVNVSIDFLHFYNFLDDGKVWIRRLKTD